MGIVSSVFSKDSGLNLGYYLSQETPNQLMQWVNVDHEQTELEVRDLGQDELEFVLASADTEVEEWIGETNAEPEHRDEYSEGESKGGFSAMPRSIGSGSRLSITPARQKAIPTLPNEWLLATFRRNNPRCIF